MMLSRCVALLTTPAVFLMDNNNGNLYSASIRHVVALMALLHHCVHQSHIEDHAKTILLMP